MLLALLAPMLVSVALRKLGSRADDRAAGEPP